jgi:hypothetical protein
VVGGSNAAELTFGGGITPQGVDAWLASVSAGATAWLVPIGGAGTQVISGLGWNGALHASVEQFAAEGDPPASLEFHDAALEGDGVLHIELAP